MSYFKINRCLLLSLLLPITNLNGFVHLQPTTTFEVIYKRTGCSTSHHSAYNSFCHSKLKPAAIRACVKKGFSGNVEEIAGSYEYDSGDAGNCSSAPGKFISYVCSSLFQCK